MRAAGRRRADVPLFRRRKESEPDPAQQAEDPVDKRIAEFRAATLAAPEPPVSDLLQELEVPYQRKGGAWLVEVGGAWITCLWLDEDASLMCFLEYAEAPGSNRDMVRANADSGLAWLDAFGGPLVTRVVLAAEDVDRTGLTLAFGAMRREAVGVEETPLEATPEPGLEEALVELSTDTGGIVIAQRGDIVDLRIELSPEAAPDEALAEWMIQLSGARSARLGIDEAGTLYAIAAIPARPVSAGALAWAIGEVRALGMLYLTAPLGD